MCFCTKQSNDIYPGIIWAPTVEVGSSKDAFLVEDPRGKVQTATIPLLIGLNNAEGGLYGIRKSTLHNRECYTYYYVIANKSASHLSH